MKDLCKQNLGNQVVEKRTERTASCSEVWTLLNGLRDELKNGETTSSLLRTLNQLEDSFTDFESAWEQHAKEYHS